MPVLDRGELESSPLADLHAIASELSLDGYRRLRKAALIDAILERQGGEAGTSAAPEAAESSAPEAVESAVPDTADADADAADESAEPAETAEESAPARRRRGRRGGRGRARDEEPSDDAGSETPEPAPERAVAPAEEPAAGEPVAEGVVEVLANGSGFLRVSPPDPSDEDIYISAAQVKRCELVSGDRISGPRRAPRRSERFASLVRVDTINGRPASEVADAARFEDLPVGYAVERFKLGGEEPTLKAIEFLTPFGRGSRVTVVGPAQAGKTEVLRRLAGVLATSEGVEVLLVLSGVRPEEVADWNEGQVTPAATVTLAGSSDAQAQAIERVVDQGRRLAARGGHVVVLIDSLSGLTPGAARRALAAARRIVDGGSLTIVATATEPLGGETTVIVLDPALTAARRFPAVDLARSWTVRPELLVGDAGAELIVRTREEALAG